MCEEGGVGGGPVPLVDCARLLRQAREEASLSKLPSDHFRNVIGWCRRSSSGGGTVVPMMVSELAGVLLVTLGDCSLTLDNQLLASNAFCLLLAHTLDPLNISLLFSKNFIMATKEPFQVRLSKMSDMVSVEVREPEMFRMCLCSGLLQLPDQFWTAGHLDWHQLMVLNMFPLLETHCFRYSPLTHLSFRALNSWISKVNSSVKPSRKILPDILLRVVRIIFSNWESAVSGVREQNVLLLEQVLAGAETLPADGPVETRYLHPAALLELVINEMSWYNKSKYFMLAVLLPKNGTFKVLQTAGNEIVVGLLHSACWSQLASAGSDLYRACLDDLSLEQWTQVFLQPIITVLSRSKQQLQKQNIFNYWMSPTLKKFRGSLQVIVDGLLSSEQEESELLFPIICCFKLGRKEGYDSMHWDSISESKYLAITLKHSDEVLRAQAFAVVCHSSKTLIGPVEREFDLVQKFLMENVNADSAALRVSLLNSFGIFMGRVRDACLQVLLRKCENECLERSMKFFDWLYHFLRENLEIGTNYQRRYTSLELYKMVMNCFGEGCVASLVQVRAGRPERRKVVREAERRGVWGFVSEEARETLLYCVSDQSADVREAAASLLVSYFKAGEGEGGRLADMYRKAVALCCDPLFYCCESGAALVLVVTALGGGPRVLGLPSERVTSTLLALAQTQAKALKEDILKAARQGAPLHGVLRAIERLVLDPASPERIKLSEAEHLKLIALLERTSSHLLQVLASKSNNISEFAPSFYEMGEAIESMVERSSVSIEESERGHLSPAYQIVLNCVWLNLKVCCSLAAGMVKGYGAGVVGAGEAWRCAQVPIRVLRGCRHKGALEAAGAALGDCVHALTSVGLTHDITNTLDEALNSLADRAPTSSTRGAGFVIMIHRMVTADSRPSKPLVGSCVERLVSMVETSRGDVSQALQLLAVLVQDSSLTQDMASHLHSLTVHAISALASTNYPIRNAGLHLFGSCVPRVVGGRRGDDAGWWEQVTYEEVCYRAPTLFARLVEELEAGSSEARTVAALALVSRLAAGPLTSIDRAALEPCHRALSAATETLLSSRSAAVRTAAAAANARLCPAALLPSLVHRRVWPASLFLTDRSHTTSLTSENQLHGFLLNTKYLLDRFHRENIGNPAHHHKQFDYKTIDQLSTAKFEKISYMCRAILSQISNYDDSRPSNRQIEDVIAAVSSCQPHQSIGLYIWTNTEVVKIISNCPLDKLVASLYTCLIHCENFELHRACLSCLVSRVHSIDFKPYAVEVLDILGHYVSTQVQNVDCAPALEIILEILVQYRDCLAGLSVENMVKALTSDPTEYRVRLPGVAVTVLCGLLAVNGWEWELAREATFMVLSRCEGDEPGREAAARGLVLLGSAVSSWPLPDSALPRANLWLAAVTLLQDESALVRSAASTFPATLAGDPHPWNPSVGLNYIFKDSVVSEFMPGKEAVHSLWSQLECHQEELSRLDSLHDGSLHSPFESAAPNLYAEPVKVIELAFECLYALISRDPDCLRVLPQQEIVPHLKHIKDHCQRLSKFYGDHLFSSNALLSNIWYIISKKISCMHRIINYVNNVGESKDLEMFELRYLSFMEQQMV